MNSKKLILSSIITCFSLVSLTSAYSVLSESNHKYIDKTLNKFQYISKKSKKEKSETYSKLANDFKVLRNAYLGAYTGDRLTGNYITKEFIERGIEKYNNLSNSQKNNMIENLKEIQYVADELKRSFQIESEEDFQGYAITILPTPIYGLNKNNVDINFIMGGEGTTGLLLDSYNTIDQLDMVLPKGTPVTLINKVETGDFTYYEIRTREFDAGYGNNVAYFLDSRFVEKQESKPSEVIRELPNKEDIYTTLLSAVGSQYIWGGAHYQGIPEINDFYPTPEEVSLSTGEQQYKILQGTDCSGLLWQTSNGYTPRNTRQLLTFGKSVPISGDSIDQIIEKVEPLDLIVWAGHVIIILNDKYAIESLWKENFEGGTEVVSLKERLEDIFTRRQPVNEWNESELPDKEKFVIRRWYNK